MKRTLDRTAETITSRRYFEAKMAVHRSDQQLIKLWIALFLSLEIEAEASCALVQLRRVGVVWVFLRKTARERRCYLGRLAGPRPSGALFSDSWNAVS